MKRAHRHSEVEVAWRPLLARLRSHGWRAEVTGPARPVTLRGRVPSGHRFRFRCRGDTCTLGIGGEDPAAPAWEIERCTDGPHSADDLTPEEAVGVLLLLHETWIRRASPA